MSDNEMTIDERLKLLLESSKALYASCQELHTIVREQIEQMKGASEREKKRRQAIKAAIKAYLEAPGEGEGE